MPRLACYLLIVLLSPVPARAADDAVTIYRCTDAKGELTLRDSPCAKGERQETRSMARPKDAPARPIVAATPAQPPTASEPARVIVLNTPRPLYECTTPDNTRYTSDSGEGNPRWVPLWTLGYPVVVDGPIVRPGGGSVRYDNGRWQGHFQTGGVSYGRFPTAAAYGAGTWIRDTCYALPQTEVCDRLRDRRDTVRRRFFNAQPSERATLGLEERSINARLGNDCSAS